MSIIQGKKLTNPTTVIIADDHPIFRKGLREIVESTGQYQVIAEAESGEKALLYYQKYQPDMIILDISMGSMNGLEVAEQILKLNKKALCVIMTMYHESEFCKQALSIGVRGYLLKDDVAEAILDCLEKVQQHKKFVSQSMGCSPEAIESFSQTEPEQDPIKVLSDKEMTILIAISELKTNKQIANEQNISHRTVQNHRQNISSKLNLSGRQALLQFALKWAETRAIL